MSLADQQRAIAALVCEPDALDAYGRAPSAWLASRALAGAPAAPLAGLDPGALAMYRDIHARDRAFFVEATMPLVTQRLGASWMDAYFAAQPYGDDDTLREIARFASFLARGSDTATAALARYEVARHRLALGAPFVAAHAPGRLLTRLAPGLAIVASPWSIPALVEDPASWPVAEPGVALLRRDEDDVSSAWLRGPMADVLLALADGRAAAVWPLLASAPHEAAYRAIAKEGALR